MQIIRNGVFPYGVCQIFNMKSMYSKNYLLLFLSIFVLISCKTQQISYFQDVDNGHVVELAQGGIVKLRPGDKISVIVSTKDQEYNNLYNLPYTPSRLGQTVAAATTNSIPQGVSCYTVDGNGDIEFPILGKVKAQDLTREELATRIKKELLDKKLLEDDPLVVTVEFVNLNISVLGEVVKPGRYNIDKDRVTILEALGMASDMTIYGQRKDVIVLRNENGKQMTYTVDLTSMDDVVKSPVYYLRQNDIVYVKPNTMRQRQATVSGNTVYTPTFWISIASLLTTIAAIIVNN